MPPPPSADPAPIAALRGDLERARWTVDAVADLLGPVATAALAREAPLPARRATAGRREPVAVLTRLLVLAEPVARRDLDAALPGLGTAGAAALGLVTAAGEGREDAVRPLVDLRPHAATDAAGEAAWWVASDLGEAAVGGPLPTDHVLGVGGASTTLAQLTVRPAGVRVLDVGTGSGVQALHAARHARGVVATDTSARALAFARFNTALAGVDVDLRRGDLLQPVVEVGDTAGERFDLVVSNPPFVVTPRRPDVPAWTYRDGGRTGDGLVREFVTGLGAVLAPGGTAQLLGDWEHRAGEDWRERVGAWLIASGLSGWVVQREVQDPAAYAETWVRDGGQRPGPAADALVAAWIDDFAARGVEAVGFGYVVLRAPGGTGGDGGAPPWRVVEERRGPVRQPLGAHLARCLDARDLLAATDDDALLATRWRVADDVTEVRHHRPGQPDPAAIVLTQTDGFARSASVDAVVAATVGACDGELTLGQITAAVAALVGAGAGQVRAAVLPAVRDLAGDALLLPVPDHR